MTTELLIDLVALVLVAAGLWLLSPAVGLIVGGIGLWWLGVGIQARRRKLAELRRTYRAIEVED